MEREINLRTREITNAELRIDTPGEGLGRKIFKSAVEEAHKAGITNILVNAFGNFECIDDWNGYYTWAVMGFSMVAHSIPDFERLMKKHGRKEETLANLIASTEKDSEGLTGKDFWRIYGDSWFGVFNVHPKSENSATLNMYIRSKEQEKSRRYQSVDEKDKK